MIDGHMHSTISHDGRMEYVDLIKKANEIMPEYFATTEHCDRDYYFCSKEREVKQLDIDKYYQTYLKNKDLANTNFAFGIEVGYCKEAQDIYFEELKKYPFDLIINSVHTLFGRDVYFGDAFENRTEQEMIDGYLDAVLGSVYAKYDYDVIAHIGYLMRYMKYPNRCLLRDSSKVKIKEILAGIIERDKCLECNGKVVGLPYASLPEPEIFKMYYDMGGRKISFGSDAHETSQMCNGYERVVGVLKDIGFTHWTEYIKREPVEFKF